MPSSAKQREETPTWTRNCEETAKGATKEETFVNHGLIRWEKGRSEWHAMKMKKLREESKSGATPDHLRQSTPLNVDEIIDIIFSPRWRMAGAEAGPPKRFPKNVPLVQMVDVLVDLWEAEGLDL